MLEEKPIQIDSTYQSANQANLINTDIEHIKQRTSLQTDSSTRIIDTVRQMTEEKRSAVLIVDDNQLVGIVTESDLCRTVIAAGQDTAQPISSIMTACPIIAGSNTSASNALILMAKHAIHHLPFRRTDGNFSTITASDLIQFQNHNPLFLIADIYGTLTLEEMKQHSKKIPELLADLVDSGLPAYHICHLMSAVSEAINQRLLQLAEQELGEPPIAYGWLVAGSLARREQTAHSDQDNALIFSDAYDSTLHRPYFEKLAKFVCDGLHACGYVYCPGNIMATNPDWQLTESQWQQQFAQWLNAPTPESLLYTSVFFDMRTIFGDISLLDGVMNTVLEQAPQQASFMQHMTTNALNFSPPIGIFRRFISEKQVGNRKTLNFKKRGVTPVIDLMRVHALAGGIRALNTKARLIAAIDKGLITTQAGNDLIVAFEVISSIRLKHQARQISQKQPSDNFVSLDFLSSLEKKNLKNAFDVVISMQKFLRFQHHNISKQ